MSGHPARDVLDVVDVMARYGLRDRRAARRLIDEAGGFMIGGRLVLRREDLLVYEEELKGGSPARAGRGERLIALAASPHEGDGRASRAAATRLVEEHSTRQRCGLA